MTAIEAAAPSDNGVGPKGQPVLEARQITVRFGGVTAVSDVSITVPAGSIVGLVGPNGAGKSTLFAAISGLIRPNAGTVWLRGVNVSALSPQRRARAGLAQTFQHAHLFAGLTVRQHVVLADRVRFSRRRIWSDLFSAREFRPPDRAEARRVATLIELLGLEGIADCQVDGMSLGLAKIVEAAQAIATEPEVLLLDEPSAGLDSHETSRFTAALRTINLERKVALLLVEHDLDMVLGMSKIVNVLDFGQLIATGPPDDIRGDPAVRTAYLGTEKPIGSEE